MVDVVNTLGGIYKFGTISVTAGGSLFTGTSTLWSVVAEQGDWILVDGQVAIITDAITDTTVVPEVPWTGGTLVNVPYVLVKMSWLRYEPAILQQKVRELIAKLAASGKLFFVAGSEPDPTDGTNGDFAIKVNDGMWLIWLKVDNEWVFQGSPVGIDVMGDYDPTHTYVINNAVGWMGKLWVSRVAGNIGNQPDISPTQWYLAVKNGDRYDISFFDTDRPASGELVDKKYPYGATFYAGLTNSYASAEVASTGTAVYSFKKNDVTFATLTFSPGNVIGVFACATTTTFGSTDKYTMVAPASRDLTLSGVGGVIIAYRTS